MFALNTLRAEVGTCAGSWLHMNDVPEKTISQPNDSSKISSCKKEYSRGKILPVSIKDASISNQKTNFPQYSGLKPRFVPPKNNSTPRQKRRSLPKQKERKFRKFNPPDLKNVLSDCSKSTMKDNFQNDYFYLKNKHKRFCSNLTSHITDFDGRFLPKLIPV